MSFAMLFILNKISVREDDAEGQESGKIILRIFIRSQFVFSNAIFKQWTVSYFQDSLWL